MRDIERSLCSELAEGREAIEELRNMRRLLWLIVGDGELRVKLPDVYHADDRRLVISTDLGSGDLIIRRK